MPSQDWIEANRAKWRYRGQERPSFALAPQPGQESVLGIILGRRALPPIPERWLFAWDPSKLHGRRGPSGLLETASPPTFYIPPDDVTMKAIERAAGGSLCEWKGQAAYWTVTVPGQRLERVGWSYPEPFPGFEAIRDYFAFTPRSSNVLWMAYAFSPSRAGFMAAG